MIQAFVPHAAQKAFADSIYPAHVRYGVRRTLMPIVVATRAKFCPDFLSLSRIKYLVLDHTEWPPAAVRTTQGSVGVRVTFAWIRLPRLLLNDEESKERTEEESHYLQKTPAHSSA